MTGQQATADQWADIVADARTRVLTRHAEQADDNAQHLRNRAPRFPDLADEMLADAQACDEYAAACRAAAADHTLPAPSGPNYPPKDNNRG